VLESMGYEFEVMSSDIDEKAFRFDDPKKLTLALAHAKADALLPRILPAQHSRSARIHEPALLITADQVIFYNGSIREKPADEKEARAFLRSYGAYPIETIAAVVVTNTATKERREGVDVARVWLTPLAESLIDVLIAEGETLSLAGGFTLRNPLLKPYIEKIEGEFESIIGLPKKLTERLIREIGG